jgi:cell cycle arrest protein BUB2
MGDSPQVFSPVQLAGGGNPVLGASLGTGGGRESLVAFGVPGVTAAGALTTQFGATSVNQALLEKQTRRVQAHERLRQRFEALLLSLAEEEEEEEEVEGGEAKDSEEKGEKKKPALPDDNLARESREKRRVEAVLELRKLVMMEGLPDDNHVNSSTDGHCSLRGRVWKILLGVREVDADLYLELVRMRECTKLAPGGSQTLYDKIRHDTFRTFKNNANFAQRVPEVQLIRVLNAFMHYLERGRGKSQAPTKKGDGESPKKNSSECTDTEHAHPHKIPRADDRLTYVQGLNVIASPFLYTMPEVDAFFAMARFVTFHTPRYYFETLDGAREGSKLLDEIVQACDPELNAHLREKALTGEVYGMPLILSYGGSSPPLDELLRVWDFIVAFGAHFGVVAAAARVILLREKLLAAKQPMAILGRQMPPIEADPIVNLMVVLVQKIPDELMLRLQRHPVREPPSPSNSGPGDLLASSGSPRADRRGSASKYQTLPRNFGKNASGGSAGGSPAASPKNTPGRRRRRGKG